MEDERIRLEPPAAIHLIGICGTGMGALAGLLARAGFAVSGSDAHPYPPMSTELESLGIDVVEGYRAENIEHRPELVVVGNVCRRDHPEAAAARRLGLRCVSMPRAVRDLFLADSEPLVICGTHGKTTTTAMLAYLLRAAGRDPSLLVGGVTADFGAGHHLGSGSHFVIEGDEYDSAYFEKRPKFLSYMPSAAVITSVEHDHVDVYPTEEDYRRAFYELAKIVRKGPLAVYAGDRTALEVARGASVPVVGYAVEGDLEQGADWLAVPDGPLAADVIAGGRKIARLELPLAGRHNARNALAATILAHEAAGVPLALIEEALPGFGGVARRQQVVCNSAGVTLYDDFAHHPTAVNETLSALAARHPDGRLLAAFEPRSATACRRLHQGRYAEAFDDADEAIIAPVGREIPDEKRLDTTLLAGQISARGTPAAAAADLEEVVDRIMSLVGPGDAVVLLSNGSFGGIAERLAARLAELDG
jgi:UDP-N-acetylmuramate: L-alanyl-gamma-D-glutamyl-meso-diaminopimelate ligase